MNEREKINQRITQLKEMRDMHNNLMNEEIVRQEILLSKLDSVTQPIVEAPIMPTPQPTVVREMEETVETQVVEPVVETDVTEPVVEETPVEKPVKKVEGVSEVPTRRNRRSLTNVHSSIQVENTVETAPDTNKIAESSVSEPEVGQIMDQVALSDAAVESVIASNENVLAARNVSSADKSAIMALGKVDDDD